MADIKTNQSKVYNALKGMGFSGIGANEEEFAAKMGNPKNREKVYNALSSKGYKGIGKDLAAFDTLIYKAQQPAEKPTPVQPTEQLKDTPQLMPSAGNEMGVGVGAALFNQQTQPVRPTPQKQAKAAPEPQPQQKQQAPASQEGLTWQEQMAMSMNMGKAQSVAENAAKGVETLGEASKKTSPFGSGNVGIGNNQNLRKGQKTFDAEKGTFVDTYLTSDGRKFNDANIANQVQSQLDENASNVRFNETMKSLGIDVEGDKDKDINHLLGEAYKELHDLEAQEREIAKSESKSRKVPLFPSMVGGPSETYTMSEESKNLSSAKRLLQRRIDALETARDKGGFWGGVGDVLTDPSSYSFGLTDLADASAMSNIGKKIEEARANGVKPQLTDSEKALARNYMLNQQAQGMNKDNFWYEMGQSFGQTLSFMKDFALTGGGFMNIAKAGMNLGAKGGAKLATKALGDYMTKNLGTKALGKMMVYGGKGLGLAAGAEAGGLALNNTAQAASSIADIMNKQMGNLTVGKDGNLSFEGSKSLGEAVLKSQLSRGGENASELVGLAFDAVPGVLGKVIQRTKVGQLAKKVADSKYWKGYEKAMNYLGIQSVWGEGMEEEYNMARDVLIGESGWFNDPNDPNKPAFFDGEQQLKTWETVGITSMLLRVPSMIATGTQAANYYGNMYNLNTSDRNMRDVFGDATRYGSVKAMIDGADNAQLAGVLNNLMNNAQLSSEEKEAMFMYANDLVKLRGFNIGNVVAAANGFQEPPKVSSYAVRGNSFDELDAEGNVIAHHEYETVDEMRAGLYEAQQTRFDNDLQSDISAMEARPNNQFGTFVQDYLTQTQLNISPEELEETVTKPSMARTEAEQQIVTQFAKALHDAVYDNTMLHEEQSAQDGVDAAESASIDVENPDSENIQEVTAAWQAAQQERNQLFVQNEELKQEVEQMEQQGMSHQEIISALETFRPNEVQTVINYYNQKARFEGMMNQVDNKINEEAANSRQRHEFKGTVNGNADLSNVYTITDGTNEYYLVSGNVTTDSDGRITGSDSGLIIGMDLDGSFVNIGDTNGYSVMPSTQSLDQFEEQERIRLQELWTGAIDPTGSLMPQEQQTGEVGGEAGVSTDTGANEPSTPESVPQNQEEVAQQPAQIPVDEKSGLKRYEQGVPVDQAIQDIQNDGFDVNEMADAYIAEAQEQIDKINAKKAKKPQDLIERKRLQDVVTYYNNIKEQWAAQNKPAVEEQPVVNPTPSQSGMTVEEKKQQRIADAKAKYGELFDDDFNKANDVYELVSMWVGRNRNLAWDDVNGKRGLQKELGWTRRFGGDTKYIETLLAKKGEGVGVDEFAHMVWESPENSVLGEKRWSTEEIKEALLDLLKNAQSKSDVVDYALNTRIAQADAAFNDEQEALANQQGQVIEQEEASIPDGGLPFGQATDEDFTNDVNESPIVPQNDVSLQSEQEIVAENAERLRIAISELTDKYNSAPIRVIDPYNMPADEWHAFANKANGEFLTDEEAEDFREFVKTSDEVPPAMYDPDSKQIVFFAHKAVQGYEGEQFFHENIHAELDKLPQDVKDSLLETFWNNSNTTAANVNKENVKQGYREDEWFEEFFAATFGRQMASGRVWKVIDRFTDEQREVVNDILNNIGYGEESENESRRRDDRQLEVRNANDANLQENAERGQSEESNGVPENAGAEPVDSYLNPRNAEEEKIISDVNKQLQQEIQAAITERDKAASELQKAQAKESERATDLFGNDNALNQPGQLFDNSDMPIDQSMEGVERRTAAERERLLSEQNKLNKLQSPEERNSRVRGALDNHRRQTSIEEPSDVRWQYQFHYDKETGRAWITRDDWSGGVPIQDGRFRIEGKSLAELRAILENPANNLDDLLNEVEAQLHNAEVGEQLRNESNPINAIEQAANQFKQEQEERKAYGADNKLISQDRYEELKKRMREKLLGQANVGFDPEILQIGAEMAMFHIEAGARKFADYATRMINDLGDVVRPYLQGFYEAARRMPGMEELRKEMDSTEAVDNFDVLNYDKQVGNTVNDNKTENNEPDNSVSLQQETSEEVGRKAEDADKYRAFSQAIANDMLKAMETGEKPYKSIKDIRAKAKSLGMEVDDNGRTDILLQELVEDGLVSAARQYVNLYMVNEMLAGRKAQEIRTSRALFEDIVKLYNLQPSITQRSSNRIKMQQYSTPLPMSFIADVFAFREGMRDVLEPTAGNGMMVFAVPEFVVHANELDETRLDNLRAQKFKEVTDQDATKTFEGEQYDAIIANPPFGTTEAKEYDGKMISGLAEQIALNALDKMKDDGKAAIIIGGNMEYAPNGAIKSDKAFFTYLYDHYNVKGVIDMDGKLYSKQGTTFPTRMILIDGRRSEEERAQSKVYPPVKDKAPKKATTFEELYDIAEEIRNNNNKTNGNEVLRTPTGIALPDNNDASGNIDRSGRDGQYRKNESDGGRVESRGSSSGSQETSSETTPRNRGRRSVGVQQPGIPGLFDSQESAPEPQPAARTSEQGGSTSDNGESRPADVRGNGTVAGGVGLNTPENPKETPKADIIQAEPVKPKVEEKRELDTEKLSYRPHNTAYSLESVAPAAMVEAMDNMLTKIEKEHGNIDEWVTKELGYDSVDEMHNALAAEQVDSVAMAIYQMQHGQGMIIGDQTGVGKGRQMAALIRWACRQGKKPVFITQKADLFSDIYRDLVDIGSGELNPFIFNSDGAMVDNNGVTVHKPLSASAQAKVFEGNQLPEGYDFAVLTYSQVNTGDAISQEEAGLAAKKNKERAKKSKKVKEGKATPKATFLRALAKDNYMFLDESHTAAGKSNTGAYFQSILKTAKGVTFASATFAKRPDTMPMYAIRTAMAKAKVKPEELIKIIENGGVTLQEIMSRALTQAGQMVRRERDMSDVVTDWKTVDDPATVKKARDNYDSTIEAFNAIIDFQRNWVAPYLDILSSQLADVASSAGMRQGTEDLGIKNVPFASKTYNYTKQLMLALKVDAIVDEVVKEIEAGRHPVIALENTMGSMLDDYSPGDPLDDTTFAASLLKGLKGILRYTITDEDGKQIQQELTPEQLGPDGAAAYHEVEDVIRRSTSGIFISPLDAITEKLNQKGYKVGELTGRQQYVELDDRTGDYVVRRRTDRDKKKMQREFNNGSLDVLILNKSASTGISLHASEKFSDQRQRTMIIAQPLADINDYMQMIGRVDRTGQVHRGYYINLGLPVPAEGRFLMMLSTKLKSLNANTTTSQDSESNDVEAPDLLNKYGSKVIIEYLRDNPDIYVKMGEPLKKDKAKVSVSQLDDYEAQEDDARKITGYVALLPTNEQDDFYNDVVRRYNELIKYLNDTGSNDLKISVLPLRARTIEKQISSEGADPKGDNPFAGNAYVEWVDMDVLKKPMKAAEVGKVIEQLNPDVEAPKVEAKTAAQERMLNDKLTPRVRQIIDTVEKETQAKLDREEGRYKASKERAEEAIKEQTEKINASKRTPEQKQEAIDKYTADRRVAVEESHNNMVNKIEANRMRLEKYLKAFKVGDPVLVPDDLTIDTFLGSTNGIFCGFKAKDEGVTPSTTLAVFATLDGRRKIEIKLSDWGALNRIENMTEQNWDAAHSVTLSNWDSQIPSETRKHGYIMTGNILQAFADAGEDGRVPGQLITYTDEAGNVHDGILMNQHWEPSQLKGSTVPLKNRMDEVKNLPNGDHIISADGNVVIDRYYRIYTITVPKSKKVGGQYYEDKRLLDLIDGRNFYPFRGQLRGDVEAENIEDVVNVLSDLGVQVKSDTQVHFEHETEMGQAQAAGRRFDEDIEPSYMDAVANEEQFENTSYQAIRNAEAAVRRYGKKTINNEVRFVFTGDYFYLYTQKEYGDIKLLAQIDIENNRELIDRLIKNYSPESNEREGQSTVRSPRDIASAIEGFRSSSDGRNRDNADVEGGRMYDEEDGSLDIRQSPKRHGNNGVVRNSSQRGKRIERHISQLLDKLGTKSRTVVHKSLKDVPVDVREHIERKHRQGKKVRGWYESGQIHLFLPDIDSEYQAEKTIWHETVAHHGLRELIGEENLDKLLKQLWLEHRDGEMGKWVTDRMQRNGWRLNEAIEEYLAREAEKNPFKEPGLWQRLRWMLAEVLHKIGFATDPTISDIQYLFWVSENQLREGDPMTKIRQQAFLFNLERQASTTPYVNMYAARPEDIENPDAEDAYPDETRYSEETDEESPLEYSAKKVYDDRLNRIETVFTEAYQDAMVSLKTAQNAIAGDNDIPDSQNAYMAENLMHGKNKNEQDTFNRMFRDPLIRTINKIMNLTGMNWGDVDRYVYTKSGLERNREFFVRDWLEAQRNKTIHSYEDLDPEAQDIYDSMAATIEDMFEDGDITEDEKNQKLKQALQKAHQRFIDEVETDYQVLKTERYQDLQIGLITFPDYLEDIDRFIRSNLDSSYKPQEHDYSGFRAMFGDEEGEYDEAEIIEELMNTEDMIESDNVDTLWEQINAATKYGLERYREAGMRSDEQIDRVEQMFHWYVPMRGFKEDTGEDMYQYFTGKEKSKNYVGGLLKHAKGRGSEANFPISTIFAMSYKAISDCNQNLVNQKLYRLCQANPNDLVVLSDSWARLNETTGEWEEVAPEIPEDADEEEVRQITLDWEDEMRQLALEHKAKKIKGREHFDYKPMDKKKQSEHIIDVRINGQPRKMIVTGNPRMAQALNGQLRFEHGKNVFSRWNSAIKNFMASVFTSYSPTFAMRNMFRDWTHFRTMLGVREGHGYAQAANKYYRQSLFKMVGLFRKYRDGTLDDRKQIERDFKDFMDEGGITGFVFMQKLDDIQKQMEKIYKDQKAGKTIRLNNNIWESILGAVEALNEGIENNARFATYRASRHYAGRTKARSAYDAKEITVNFNRKGAGGKTAGFKSRDGILPKKAIEDAAKAFGITSQILGEGRIFFNATVQAIATTFKNFQNPDGSLNKKYIAKWAAKYALPPFMFGLALPMINKALAAAFGGDDGDDDPYANLAEWTRRKNLCFYIGNGNFITIPIGQELAAFLALGDMLAGATYAPDLKPVDKNFGDEFIGVMNTFSPVDIDTKLTKGGFTEDPIDETIGRTFSVLAPLVAVQQNLGWTGRPIYREDVYPNDKYSPEYQMVYSGTNPVLVGASKLANELSGGDDVTRGGIQVNPAIVQYLWEQYTGGPGKVFSNTISIGKDAKDILTGSDNDFNIRKVEGLKAFVQQGDDRTAYYRTQAKYRKYKADADELSFRVSGYEKAAAEDPAALLKLEEIVKGEDFVRMQIIKEAEKTLSQINKAANKAEGKERKELRQIYNQSVKEVVDMLDSVGKE